MDITLGVDFDNTIVQCGELFHKLAVQRKIIPAATAKDKQAVRKAVRQREGGEIEWQKIQAFVYGPLLQQASPVAGVVGALELCRKRNVWIYIISHKSRYAAQDDSGTDLRVEAMRWLKNNGVLGPVDEGHVFFEASRADKLGRIGATGCSHFVDDLLETFLEPLFPPNVTKVLFDPGGNAVAAQTVKAFNTWEDIVEYVFETGSPCRG